MKRLDTYLDLCTQVYDLSKPSVPEDAYAFYESYVSEAKGSILEPMCGTGRFLLPLLKSGYEIEGFDASAHMLRALKGKATNARLRVKVWHGFIESLEQDKKYDLIFIPSGSFGLLVNLEVARLAISKIYAHLNVGGIFVFEVETLKAIVENCDIWTSSRYSDERGKVIVARFLSLPAINNVQTTCCKYERLGSNSEVILSEEEELRVRFYDPGDLVIMLEDVGFQDVRILKAFDRFKVPEKSDEVVVLECKK